MVRPADVTNREVLRRLYWVPVKDWPQVCVLFSPHAQQISNLSTLFMMIGTHVHVFLNLKCWAATASCYCYFLGVFVLCDDYHGSVAMHSAVVSSSNKTGTFDKELYHLMRSTDLHQIFTRPRCWQEILLVNIWWRSELCIKRSSSFSAVLSVPSKHHSDIYL